MTTDPTLQIKKPSFIATPIGNMVADISGGSTSFLKQLCEAIRDIDFSSQAENDFASLLTLIECLLQSSPQGVQDHWIEGLHSFDNRKLFQSIGELVSIGHLVNNGWTVEGCQNDCIELNHPTKGQINLLVLSLILQRDLTIERRLLDNLTEKLNSIESPFQIGVTLRSPLSPRTDINQVVVTARKWIKKRASSTRRHRKSGYFKDNYTHIDFSVVSPKETDDTPTVSHTIPPVIGRQMHHAVEQMLSASAERYRQQQAKNGRPLVLSIVSNQSMQLSERAWKFLLYGVPKFEFNVHTELDTRHFGGWFQDPFRTFVSGIMRLEHTPTVPKGVPCFSALTFSNPWSEFSTLHNALPTPGYQHQSPQKREKHQSYTLTRKT